jgi:hypothetical protein
MSTKRREYEQRKSFRCRVAQPRQAAELKVGRRRIPIVLFNESAGGFGAWVECDPRVKAGELLQLMIGPDRLEVRVAHVTEVEAASAEPECGKPLFRVGLKRLRELDAAPGERAAAGRFSRERFLPSSTSIVVGATLLIVAVVMGGFGMVLHDAGAGRQGMSVWGRSPLNNPLPRARQSLGQVVRNLGLSAPQQEDIQEIAESSAQTLRQLDAQWADDPPEERSRKQAIVLEAARREVYRLLDEKQRERWKSLFE